MKESNSFTELSLNQVTSSQGAGNESHIHNVEGFINNEVNADLIINPASISSRMTDGEIEQGIKDTVYQNSEVEDPEMVDMMLKAIRVPNPHLTTSFTPKKSSVSETTVDPITGKSADLLSSFAKLIENMPDEEITRMFKNKEIVEILGEDVIDHLVVSNSESKKFINRSEGENPSDIVIVEDTSVESELASSYPPESVASLLLYYYGQGMSISDLSLKFDRDENYVRAIVEQS